MTEKTNGVLRFAVSIMNTCFAMPTADAEEKMKDKRILRIILLTFGWALLLTASVLLIITLSGTAGLHINNGDTVGFIESVIPEAVPGFKDERSNIEMPSVTFDGQDYAAILSYPRFSVKLPIRSAWDKAIVNKVPCLFTGSIYDGTLVIGGVDAGGQFDFISEIDIGDVFTLTDMNGYVYPYAVSTVKHAKDAKADTLINEAYDLTLFAKDRKSGDWLLIRCKMK